MPRLFIYTREAQDNDEPAKTILTSQNLLMQWRLWYIITWPSAIITFLLGMFMLHQYGSFPSWLVWKLGLVTILYIYHFICHSIFIKQQKGIFTWSSAQLRIWNEVATVLLFVIVFLVVIKIQMSIIWALFGVLLLSMLLMLGIKTYDKIRKK